MATPLIDPSTGIPIEVHATDPPGMCVTALGHELFLDVWNPLFPNRVLICVTGQALIAVYGVGSAAPARPALPADAHALAEVLVPIAAERITEEDIFQLTDSPL